jgi:hypothetical protein
MLKAYFTAGNLKKSNEKKNVTLLGFEDVGCFLVDERER